MKKIIISIVTIVFTLSITGCNTVATKAASAESAALIRDAGKLRDDFFEKNIQLWAEEKTSLDYPQAKSCLSEAVKKLERGKNEITVHLEDDDIDREVRIAQWVALDTEDRETYREMLTEKLAYDLAFAFSEGEAGPSSGTTKKVTSIEVKYGGKGQTLVFN